MIARELTRLAGGAVQAWADAVVAAGDPFDGLQDEWALFIESEVGPVFAAMHQAGSLTATLGTTVPDAKAQAWADVVNARAVEYQAAATNRVVGMGPGMWEEVRGLTVRAVAKGATNEALKEAIEDATGYSEFRADTIGRTETVAAYNGGEFAGAQALGDDGPTEKSWLAALDARTRDSHAEADGQTVAFGEPFIVGGVPMQHPHDAGAPPEEVVNCRCVMELLYPGDARPDGSTVPGREPDVTMPDADG